MRLGPLKLIGSNVSIKALGARFHYNMQSHKSSISYKGATVKVSPMGFEIGYRW